VSSDERQMVIQGKFYAVFIVIVTD